jgi:hypothetical protein
MKKARDIFSLVRHFLYALSTWKIFLGGFISSMQTGHSSSSLIRPPPLPRLSVIKKSVVDLYWFQYGTGSSSRSRTRDLMTKNVFLQTNHCDMTHVRAGKL